MTSNCEHLEVVPNTFKRGRDGGESHLDSRREVPTSGEGQDCHLERTLSLGQAVHNPCVTHIMH
jgi:hypothetical protein